MKLSRNRNIQSPVLFCPLLCRRRLDSVSAVTYIRATLCRQLEHVLICWMFGLVWCPLMRVPSRSKPAPRSSTIRRTWEMRRHTAVFQIYVICYDFADVTNAFELSDDTLKQAFPKQRDRKHVPGVENDAYLVRDIIGPSCGTFVKQRKFPYAKCSCVCGTWRRLCKTSFITETSARHHQLCYRRFLSTRAFHQQVRTALHPTTTLSTV